MRLALLIARLAVWILPRQRAEWGEAMRAELHHLDENAALRWALGALFASLKERAMTRIEPKIADRWNITFALIYAGALLIVTKLLKGHGSRDSVLMALTVVWMVPYFWLSAAGRRGCRKL
jgi:hypothetical protein